MHGVAGRQKAVVLSWVMAVTEALQPQSAETVDSSAAMRLVVGRVSVSVSVAMEA
jgi:hypothetical protein